MGYYLQGWCHRACYPHIAAHSIGSLYRALAGSEDRFRQGCPAQVRSQHQGGSQQERLCQGSAALQQPEGFCSQRGFGFAQRLQGDGSNQRHQEGSEGC